MNQTNENVKDYIAKKGREIHWIMKKARIEEMDMEDFLKGKGNKEIVTKIENLFGEENGFFEKRYKTPKSIEEQLQEMKKEQEKEYKESNERYERKKKELLDEVEKALDIFGYSYFDEEDNELILNRENTIYISLGKMQTEDEVMTVERMKYEIGNVMLRFLVKGFESKIYLKQLNEYLESDAKIEELQKYYERYKNLREGEKYWELMYLMNNRLDFAFENFE